MPPLGENAVCCANTSKKKAPRLAAAARWMLPATVLFLVPKCPLCLMAYIAFATGIGISVSTAAGIRFLLFACCLALFAHASLRSLRSPRLNGPNGVRAGK